MTQLERHSHAFPLVRQTLLAASVIAVVCSVSTVAAAATVTDLKAAHRNGQTFITFTKNAGSGAKTTYDVYRDTSPITSGTIGGLTPIATLTQDSGRLLYADDPGSATDGQNLMSGFIVEDDGSHLAPNKSLLVWTTASSGTYCYAVTNSGDSTVIGGMNSLSSCVAETRQEVPGVIRLNRTSISGYTLYRYFAWEDYSTWDHSEWGYYGHRFNVMVPTSGISAPFPLLLYLHSAGEGGYFEPRAGLNADVRHGVIIQARDNDFSGIRDPYTGTSVPGSRWFGRFDTAAGLYKSVTEDRLLRYVKLVRDNATGDSVDFQLDSNRIYVYGASLGGASMHIASHYPDIFAAAGSSIGWIDSSWGGGSTERVNSSSGPTLSEYLDMAYQAAHTRLPPIYYAFGANDSTINPANYPAALAVFETHHQAYMAQWKDTGHSEYAPSYSQWNPNQGAGYLRFALNEAYPAFGNASTSDRPPTMPAPANGQRNGYLDWGSGLHPVGAPIEDSVKSFGITLRSLSVDASADVTIRNAQQFLPESGQRVEWRNESQTGQVLQSGVAVADGQGLVTVRVQIAASGNRLTLSCSACTARVVDNDLSRAQRPRAVGKVSPPQNVRIVRP